MKKLFLSLVLFAVSSFAFAQTKEPVRSILGTELKEPNFHLGLDLQTKYIWRGMEMIIEDASPVLFPSVSFQNKGYYAYVMGGYSINGKYSEVDMGLSYTYKWITVGINDYYYPTTTMPNDQYFNLRPKDTGHWLEAVVTIAPEKIPAYLTVSNFFAGADKDLDGNQAYSTYVEVGAHYDFLNDHRLVLAAGIAFNKSCYNAYEDDFGVCNLEFKYTYNVNFNDRFILPLSVAYIVNPVFNKSFVNFIASFAF